MWSHIAVVEAEFRAEVVAESSLARADGDRLIFSPSGNSGSPRLDNHVSTAATMGNSSGTTTVVQGFRSCG